ncbi:helix-turn-helix domain-containing protein [Novosphingobium umbonatum]|uniref:helix-turn-helix domain-containing protein n=1 Tax=Novosphingobium umbonatum TaxID=1908524 RepID=UPI001FE3AFB0|nr:helix-turn-helix domain-containing protein [Novosphingobium umbonatum]
METATQNDAAPLAYDIATAARISSIGQTKLFELIASGRLSTSKIGRRRLIHADSLHQLVKEGC